MSVVDCNAVGQGVLLSSSILRYRHVTQNTLTAVHSVRGMIRCPASSTMHIVTRVDNNTRKERFEQSQPTESVGFHHDLRENLRALPLPRAAI